MYIGHFADSSLNLKEEERIHESGRTYLPTAVGCFTDRYILSFRRTLTHPLGLSAPTPKLLSGLFVYDTFP
jgi:hypothetical protein